MDTTLKHLKGKVAIVTGASSGIGEAIVEALVVKGLKVVGLARRKDKLELISKRLHDKAGKFHPFLADVTKEEDIVKAFEWVTRNLGPVSVLVNNAGMIRMKPLLSADTQSLRDTLDTNVLGLCIATKLAVTNMKENNIDGHIIHINSVAGHYVPCLPNLNIYAASKFAVTALTETLRQELNSIGSKIKITSISPGFVRTELIIAGRNSEEQTDNNIFENLPGLKPEDIADSVIYVLSTPPHVQVHEMIIKPIGETF